MHDYFEEQEYFVDQVSFYHNDSRYQGNGIMTWNPNSGFHIAGRVNRSKPHPPRQEIKMVSIDRSNVLRMKLDDGLWAVAPNVR
jgi:hypothetical protein